MKTNAEYYLKDGVDIEEFAGEITDYYNNEVKEDDMLFHMLYQATVTFMKKQRKPTLIEDERVILRNLSKDYIFIGKKDKFLYIKADKENEDYFAGNVRGLDIIFPNLFQFIKERRRI